MLMHHDRYKMIPNDKFVALACNRLTTNSRLSSNRWNNMHAFTVSEPCILPVFCYVIQAVGYKHLKHDGFLFSQSTRTVYQNKQYMRERGFICS